MAAVMARILNKKLNDDVAPVMAKAKTEAQLTVKKRKKEELKEVSVRPSGLSG